MEEDEDVGTWMLRCFGENMGGHEGEDLGQNWQKGGSEWDGSF